MNTLVKSLFDGWDDNKTKMWLGVLSLAGVVITAGCKLAGDLHKEKVKQIKEENN